ncbi:MAG: NADH-quinone oxidoreductase subunit L, partial [Sphingomonadales bacterium]|nr:NADH-quinone oxidoreductase subunit L [Sphingomonadales bacterium]
QDMRKMGGIRTMIPITYMMMMVGTLALTGIPPFAGYFSKDMVIEAAYAAQTGVGEYAFVMGIAAAFMTSFYSWRLIFMTFHGKSRADEKTLSHVHESPAVMLMPLFILALGAVFAGYVFYDNFVGEGRDAFWNGAIFILGDDVIDAAHHVPTLVKYLPLIMSLSGFLFAIQFYVRKPHLAKATAEGFKHLYQFLLNKWYFDEIYDFLFVKPTFAIGRILWKKGDEGIVDAYGPDGVSSLVMKVAGQARKLQSGYVYHYAFAMMIGVVALVTYLMLKGGAF